MDGAGSREESRGAATGNAAARARIDAPAERLHFLVEASAVLGSSLDYETTLGALARLAVPAIADYCMIDVLGEGEFVRVAVAHADPSKAALLEYGRRYRVEPDSGSPVAAAFAAGRAELVSPITQPWLQLAARGTEHLDVIESLAPESLIMVPLVARDRALGLVVFVTAGSGRNYDADDLELAQELGARAAIAIDNARLFRAQEQAVRTREEVLAVVSHDLRNPLNTILMAAGFLLELLPEEDASRRAERRQLQIIRRAVDRMNRLIQDLLDVSRMEAGRFALEVHPVRIGPLLDDACEQHRPLATNRGLELLVDTPDADLVANADRDRLFQVLSNLLGNAINFTPAGGRVVLCVREHEDTVWFEVEDTGPGIRPEDQPHLFDAFWQAKQSGREGAGLGLAIARGIVVAHGGRIWVDSAPGAGTRFCFTIPLSRTPGRESSAQPVGAPLNQAGAPAEGTA